MWRSWQTDLLVDPPYSMYEMLELSWMYLRKTQVRAMSHMIRVLRGQTGVGAAHTAAKLLNEGGSRIWGATRGGCLRLRLPQLAHLA